MLAGADQTGDRGAGPSRWTPVAAYVLLLGALILPSLGTVYRYGRGVGVAVYCIVVAVAVVWGVGWYRRYAAMISTRAVWVLSAGCLAVMAVGFVVMYPMAQSGRLGPGSDGDDALNLAISELLEGRYPYYAKTYLGNPISPLPGAIFLGMPFHVIAGNAAYQNIFWVIVFFGVVTACTGDVRAGLLALLLLGSMPGFLRAHVVGNDYATNAMMVVCFIQLVLLAQGRPAGGAAVAAILLGLALSFRANFLLAAPLLFSGLWQRRGMRAAAGYTLLACVVAAGVTLPFAAYDFQGFSPLHAAGKLQVANSLLPHADVWILCLSLLVTVYLSVQRSNRDDAGLFRNIALSQLVAPLSLFVLTIQSWREEPFGSLQYSVFFAVPAIYAFVLHRGREERRFRI